MLAVGRDRNSRTGRVTLNIASIIWRECCVTRCDAGESCQPALQQPLRGLQLPRFFFIVPIQLHRISAPDPPVSACVMLSSSWPPFGSEARASASGKCVRHSHLQTARIKRESHKRVPAEKKGPPSPKNALSGSWCHTTPLTNSSLTGSPCRHPVPPPLSFLASGPPRTLEIGRAGGRVRGRPLKILLRIALMLRVQA